jgi:hypothetical protein
LQVDDLHASTSVALVENTHFWWVDLLTFSSGFLLLKAKADAAEKVLAAAAAAVVAQAATAKTVAAAPTEVETRASALYGNRGMFIKSPAARGVSQSGEPITGSEFKCFDPLCKKSIDPYFVAVGGTNKNLWAHALKHHAGKLAELGIHPANQRTHEAPDGTITRQLDFDNDLNFSVNAGIIKYLQAKGLPLSHVESKELRAAISKANAEVRMCCYKTAVDMQRAHRAALEKKERAHFQSMRKEGHLLGLQFDMWSRHGENFASVNYTYLEMEELETDSGMVPTYVVKTAVLDFALFEEPHSAVNMEAFLEKTIAVATLTWADVALLVPDGAANCVATLKLLKFKVPSGVCYIHDLARAVLLFVGYLILNCNQK